MLKFRTIWFSCIWTIRKARNEHIFQGREVLVENMVEQSKLTYWKWLTAKLPNFGLLYCSMVFKSLGMYGFILVNAVQILLLNLTGSSSLSLLVGKSSFIDHGWFECGYW